MLTHNFEVVACDRCGNVIVCGTAVDQDGAERLRTEMQSQLSEERDNPFSRGSAYRSLATHSSGDLWVRNRPDWIAALFSLRLAPVAIAFVAAAVLLLLVAAFLSSTKAWWAGVAIFCIVLAAVGGLVGAATQLHEMPFRISSLKQSIVIGATVGVATAIILGSSWLTSFH